MSIKDRKKVYATYMYVSFALIISGIIMFIIRVATQLPKAFEYLQQIIGMAGLLFLIIGSLYSIKYNINNISVEEFAKNRKRGIYVGIIIFVMLLLIFGGLFLYNSTKGNNFDESLDACKIQCEESNKTWKLKQFSITEEYTCECMVDESKENYEPNV